VIQKLSVAGDGQRYAAQSALGTGRSLQKRVQVAISILGNYLRSKHSNYKNYIYNVGQERQRDRSSVGLRYIAVGQLELILVGTRIRHSLAPTQLLGRKPQLLDETAAVEPKSLLSDTKSQQMALAELLDQKPQSLCLSN
jgi:hypothetical protein